MEVHGAISAGVFTALVDQHSTEKQEPVKPSVEIRRPSLEGTATYSPNEEGETLVATITERGTMFDMMF
ncbi:hypothetical protein KAR48_17820 [bacterium]|nr:hypothetical protein [bacterium]